jgi:hypothetical protein
MSLFQIVLHLHGRSVHNPSETDKTAVYLLNF